MHIHIRSKALATSMQIFLNPDMFYPFAYKHPHVNKKKLCHCDSLIATHAIETAPKKASKSKQEAKMDAFPKYP